MNQKSFLIERMPFHPFHFDFFLAELMLSLTLMITGSDGQPSLESLSKILTPIPDYGLSTPEVIGRRGFGYELHSVLSLDGSFENGIYRILPPATRTGRTGYPVLMVHGLLLSSNNYLVTGDDGFADEPDDVMGVNLGFEIAKRGYDVWLLDQRGIGFSRNNTRFSPDQPGYWDWSLDDMALFDLPAVIDYVIQQTGHKTIGCLGYSQVNVALFLVSHPAGLSSLSFLEHREGHS